MLEYGFRQAIRDEVLAAVREQKNLYDSMAAAIERRMSPIIEEEVRNHFLRRLDQLEPAERDEVIVRLQLAVTALETVITTVDTDRCDVRPIRNGLNDLVNALLLNRRKKRGDCLGRRRRPGGGAMTIHRGRRNFVASVGRERRLRLNDEVITAKGCILLWARLPPLATLPPAALKGNAASPPSLPPRCSHGPTIRRGRRSFDCLSRAVSRQRSRAYPPVR